MKLKSFRIQNYKSIIDSGECIISSIDNITILAGQNESGKSSILQALRDFHDSELSPEAIRIDNEIPLISCTYTLEEQDIDDVLKYLNEQVVLSTAFEKILGSLKEITIVKTFNDLTNPIESFAPEFEANLEKIRSIEVDNKRTEETQIREGDDSKNNVSNAEIEEADDENEILGVESEDYIWNIVVAFDLQKPRVIFFDDFCDLLPDKILINDLKAKNKSASGYQAVKNIETILDADLAKLDTLPDSQLNKAQTKYHKTITANFNEKWTQRIGETDSAKIYIQYNQGRAANSSYLNFFIETKDEEFLPPRQRSQGFRWFLSFYLHLKAESERNNSLIILFDEPGLFLHSRAQNDMMTVFEELAQRNQIIYSTHSPYLIDTSKLHRIKLVLNTKQSGTTIEKITTGKIQNQKDALKPIIDAVGLEVAHNFSVAKKKNVLLEGVSDFYYLEAFRQILNRKEDFSFVPAMGASNVHLLMELCIGWGLEWLIVFDDKGITKDYNKIKKSFFNNNETEANKKILKLSGFDGIEELFDNNDINKILPDIDYKPNLKKGDFINSNGGKELNARLFLEKINTNQFKKEDFSVDTLKNFERIFDFISERFGFKK